VSNFILARPAFAPSVSDRGAHEEMEQISTCHFDKFSVWSQNTLDIIVVGLTLALLQYKG
jgi:hypothetical protein